MKRSSSNINRSTIQECERKIAFHEAGHAAAIYIRNQQMNLPPVFFQIKFNSDFTITPYDTNRKNSNIQDDVATIEGGCLIHNLPVSLIESRGFFSDEDHHAYLEAINADIVNILAGPLAEAKYCAIHDNEWQETPFDNIEVLKNYGGSYDVNKINDYLSSYISCQSQRNAALEHLLEQALAFINMPCNWYAIVQLAEYIIRRTSDIISCEQIAENIDNSIGQWDSGQVVSFNHFTQFRTIGNFAA